MRAGPPPNDCPRFPRRRSASSRGPPLGRALSCAKSGGHGAVQPRDPGAELNSGAKRARSNLRTLRTGHFTWVSPWSVWAW